MNLRFLEAFVWVARLRSFKAAADRLHTTQAGISGRIATLEEQFGVRLFERDRRAVTLTYDGTVLLPHAERMLDLQDRMRAAIGRPDAHSGMLRIGVIETVVHTWLPELLSRFARRYPNVTVELTSDLTPRLREALLHGTLDCAITSEEITQGFVENRRVAELPMRWATSPALAARLPARVLSFADIAEHPIISFHRESMVYRAIAQGASGCPNLRVNFFSSLAAMIDLARAGFGVAPLPLAVIRDDLANGRLVALDVEPAPAALPLVASVRADQASPLAESLAELACATCDDFLAGATSPAPGGVADGAGAGAR
jgi:DNA-binding transcriptional LysR family regulator